MITEAVAQAGIKAATSMESGLADLADLCEEIVADLQSERESLASMVSERCHPRLYQLAQVVRAVTKTQRTQAKYLRLILEGYQGEPQQLVVTPQHEPGVGGAPVQTGPPINGAVNAGAVPLPDPPPFDPNNPLGAVFDALKPKPAPPPPHIPPAENESF